MTKNNDEKIVMRRDLERLFSDELASHRNRYAGEGLHWRKARKEYSCEGNRNGIHHKDCKRKINSNDTYLENKMSMPKAIPGTKHSVECGKEFYQNYFFKKE